MKNDQKIGIILIIFVFLVNFLLNSLKFVNFSFDLDEIFTINYTLNIDNLHFFKYVDSDLGNPPVFFFLLKPFTMVSRSVLCLRSLPMAFYLFSLFIIYKTLNLLKIPERLRILTMVMIIGIGPYFYLSLYVRAYSLLLLLKLITVYLTLNLIEEYSFRRLIELAVTVFLGFYTHYIYWVFFVLWVASYLIIGQKNKISLTKQARVLKGYLIGLMFSLPLIFNLLRRELIDREIHYDWWQLERLPISLIDWTEILFKIDFSQFVYSKYIIFLLWTVFFLISLFIIKKKNRSLSEQIVLVFNGIFLLVFFNTSLANRLSMSKYIAAFILLMSLSFPIILNSFAFLRRICTQKYLFVFFFISIVLWSFLPMLNKHRVDGGDDWKTITAVVENEYPSYALVTDCVQTDGFNFYGENKHVLYGSSAHLSNNFCNLPDIKDYKEQLSHIVVVGDIQDPAALGISDTHQLTEVIEEYQPITLTIYEKR